ncbi:chemotaxis protein CheD [Desulfovibrio inopinatus]|uniref:chemotaxis protein CheD n=1 Tax=Desulfovibrio inopinatus TaxID=102109 RepID=UPI000423BF80|nr:chemotaxis protein CheD [Desulfovibrio inopinatus]
MAKIVIGISQMGISSSHEDVLVTHSLGSCLGLAAYDPNAKVGAILHCLLPTPQNGRHRENLNPFMFVSSGIPEMMRQLMAKRATKMSLVLKAAGCGRMMRLANNKFDIGAKNFAILAKLFEKNNIRLASKDIGGSIPRTMYLHMDTGRVVISSRGKEWEL